MSVGFSCSASASAVAPLAVIFPLLVLDSRPSQSVVKCLFLVSNRATWAAPTSLDRLSGD